MAWLWKPRGSERTPSRLAGSGLQVDSVRESVSLSVCPACPFSNFNSAGPTLWHRVHPVSKTLRLLLFLTVWLCIGLTVWLTYNDCTARHWWFSDFWNFRFQISWLNLRDKTRLKSRFESRVCMKLSSQGRRLVDCPVFLFHCDWDMCYVSYVLQTATCDYNFELQPAARKWLQWRAPWQRQHLPFRVLARKLGTKMIPKWVRRRNCFSGASTFWQPVFSPTPVQSALVWLLVVDMWIWDFWIWNWKPGLLDVWKLEDVRIEWVWFLGFGSVAM